LLPYVKIPFCNALQKRGKESKKRPTYEYAGRRKSFDSRFFCHPDYTVGFGITPNQRTSAVAGYTAGEESHLAPKKMMIFV